MSLLTSHPALRLRPARPLSPWQAARHSAAQALRVAALSLVTMAPALADPLARLAAPNGVAVGGFDPVAYFADASAIPGLAEVALRWRGVLWHFASPEHRAAFEANPKAFIPQFGGFCPVSLAEGRRIPADPAHWVILDGRLYLTVGASELAILRSRPQAVVTAARGNWSRRSAGND